jgi:hypothetical protein
LGKTSGERSINSDCRWVIEIGDFHMVVFEQILRQRKSKGYAAFAMMNDK